MLGSLLFATVFLTGFSGVQAQSCGDIVFEYGSLTMPFRVVSIKNTIGACDSDSCAKLSTFADCAAADGVVFDSICRTSTRIAEACANMFEITCQENQMVCDYLKIPPQAVPSTTPTPTASDVQPVAKGNLPMAALCGGVALIVLSALLGACVCYVKSESMVANGAYSRV